MLSLQYLNRPQELEAIKARVREMEEEAEKLKELQNEVEKQMNLSPPPGECVYVWKGERRAIGTADKQCRARAGTWKQLGRSKFSFSTRNLDSFQERHKKTPAAFTSPCADIKRSQNRIVS